MPRKKPAATTNKKSFSELWQPNPPAFAQKITRNKKLALAGVGLACAFNAKNFRLPSNPKRALLVGAYYAVNLAGAPYLEKKAESFKKDQEKQLIKSAENSGAAPRALQQTAERLFKKAGLTHTPSVSVTSGFLRDCHELKTYIDQESSTAHIIIGSNLLDKLNQEEVTAAIAWETASLMAEKPQPLQQILRKNKLNYLNIAFGAAAMSRDLKSLASAAGANVMLGGIPGVFLASANERVSVLRTDRNAVGLFPHPDALKEALRKQYSQTVEPRNKITNAVILATRPTPPLSQRLDAIDQHYQEAVEFYKSSGLKLDTDDIMGLTTPKPPQKPKTNKKGPRPDQ